MFYKAVLFPFIIFSSITRIFLLIIAYIQSWLSFNLTSITKIIYLGLVRDLIFVLYFFSFIYLILLIIPKFLRNNKILYYTSYYLYFLILISSGFIEFIVWKEYKIRYSEAFYSFDFFNKIKNIITSSNVIFMLIAIFILTTIVYYFFIKRFPYGKQILKLKEFFVIILITIVISFAYEDRWLPIQKNQIEQKLSKNGFSNLVKIGFKRLFYIKTTKKIIKKIS